MHVATKKKQKRAGVANSITMPILRHLNTRGMAFVLALCMFVGPILAAEARLQTFVNTTDFQISCVDGTIINATGLFEFIPGDRNADDAPTGPGPSGNRGGGTQTATTTPEAPVDPAKLRALQNAVATERTALVNAAQNTIMTKDRYVPPFGSKSALNRADWTNFQASLTKFEERAVRQGLTAQQVKTTYVEITKLFTTNSDKISAGDASRLGEQLLFHAAVPTSINQGAYPTCNVTDVQVRLFSLQPDKITQTMVNVGLTGGATVGGKEIKLDATSLRLGDGESLWTPTSNGRSYATQLTNIFLINVWYNDQNTGKPENQRVRWGRIEQAGSEGPMVSEGLFRGSTLVRTDSPNLGTNTFNFIYNTVTGGTDSNFIIKSGQLTSSTEQGTVRVSTQNELIGALDTAAANGKFPVIVQVWTGPGSIFYQDPKDPGAAEKGGTGGWHVVTVHGWDKDAGRISVDNTWGAAEDKLGGDSRPTVGQLFNSLTNSTTTASAPRAGAVDAPNSAGGGKQISINDASSHGISIKVSGDGHSTDHFTVEAYKDDVKIGATQVSGVCATTSTDKPAPPESVSVNLAPAPGPIQQVLKAATELYETGQLDWTNRSPEEFAQLAIWKNNDPTMNTKEWIKNKILKAADGQTVSVEQQAVINQSVEKIDQTVTVILNNANLTRK